MRTMRKIKEPHQSGESDQVDDDRENGDDDHHDVLIPLVGNPCAVGAVQKRKKKSSKKKKKRERGKNAKEREIA